MVLDFSRCRLPPFTHQRQDVVWLLGHPYALIASEMRTGKTKIVIDAAQFLYEDDVIDKVIIVAPAPVRDVWADRTLGELAKHLWVGLPSVVTEYHSRIRAWVHCAEDLERGGRRLEWWVTNYEFLRRKTRLMKLMAAAGHRALLVLDESSYVKNYAAQQTKACLQLRRNCGRVVLLNGTPIFHSPMDLFSQGNILHPSVLDCKYVTKYKARYAVQAPVLGAGGKPLDNGYGKAVQKVVGWTNLDDLQRRFAPVTVRRLQKECLDLPPKLDPVALTAVLEPETWRAYKEMRDELVVWLKDGTVATSATAAVKALRLSQITGGFLGGVEDASIDQTEWIGEPQIVAPGHMRQGMRVPINFPVQEIGREKLDVLLWFIERRLEADPDLHLVAWCRFRAEAFRALDAVRERFPRFEVGAILGGQKRDERLAALALLKPETSPRGPVFVAGIEGTGSFGLDMTAAHTCVTLSSGYSPGRSAQTLDRVYGPGQTHPIAYFDVVATGPKGQRTIDHAILEARRAGEDVAMWTATAWIRKLSEE